MMKKSFILLLAIALFSCKHEETLHTVETVQAKTELKESASNLFEQVKVFPLETTDSSLVGLYISHIIIWENKIFIKNHIQSHRNILCFDMSGKFLFKIDKIGQGPGEYTFLDGFFIDEKLNHVVLMNDPEFTHFDMQGNFLYGIRSGNNYYARHIIYLNDSTYLAFNDGGVETDVPKGTSLIYLDPKTMDIRDSSSDMDEYCYNIGNNHIVKSRHRVLGLSYNDSIYDISDIHNVHVAYLVDNGLEQAKIKQNLRSEIDRLTEYGEQMYLLTKFFNEYYFKGELLSIGSIYENDKYLALGCSKPVKNTDNSIEYTLFYDKQSKKTYNSENIDFDGVKLLDLLPLGTDGESLYCILYSAFSEEDKAKIKNSTAFSEADRKKLIEFDEEDNPLLIVLK